MSEQWADFSSSIADRDARVHVNAAAASSPDPARPTLLHAKFGILAPDDAGLSTPDEDEDLEVLRNIAAKVVEIRCHAVFVGSITTAGRYELYFYAANADGLEAAATEALVDFEEYKVELGSKPDPDWKHVRDVMTPPAGGN